MKPPSPSTKEDANRCSSRFTKTTGLVNHRRATRRYSNPRVVVQEHQGAPLLNWSDLVLVRQLFERLGIVGAIDRTLRLLRRCKWYRESDHILTLIYNILGGDNTLNRAMTGWANYTSNWDKSVRPTGG